MNYSFISTDQDLINACDFYQSCDVIAVDTEFKRESTYYPIPCLIQLAAQKHIVCIDPIHIQNLDPLRKVLCNEKSIKILHAGRQDIEVFTQLIDCAPAPLFDTQIAAELLGYSAQIGYSALVKLLLNIELDKSLTRTDWEKRPLSKQELDYAAADVAYLEEIYNILQQQLIEKKRLNWLTEETENIFHENAYQDSLDKVWKKILRSNKFDQKQRNVLYALNTWREDQAKSRNRARQFVFSNDVLINIALQLPQNLNQLKQINKIPRPVLNRYSDTILKIVNDDTTQQLAIPIEEPYAPLNQEQSETFKKLKSKLQLIASELNIEQSVICNRKTLEKLARGDIAGKLSEGWRHEVAGKALKELLPANT